jgi:polygalacturonase
MFDDCHNITLTSNTQKGLIRGHGPQWWGIPFLGYLQLTEHRPTMLRANLTTDLLIEYISFQEAPCYNMMLSGVDRVEIHHVSIVARRTHLDGHSAVDLSAFNTDGIDVSGHNVWVHDVDIWNQDDCIAVKDNEHGNQISSNMTFERITASGLGFVIGSIGGMYYCYCGAWRLIGECTHHIIMSTYRLHTTPFLLYLSGSTVRNITFRDSYLYQSFKGIYLKFRNHNNPVWQGQHGRVEDILFQNITIEEPIQWGVWIGPAQQADT